MAIFKLDNSELRKLSQSTFQAQGLTEVGDLQQMLLNDISPIDDGLFIISSEFGNWESSYRRIDILCIDTDANLVVVELKRTEDGGHMELQALRYAAMISQMTFDKAVKAHEDYLKKRGEDHLTARESILGFLDWEEEREQDFGNEVKIVLVSANFSKELTTSVIWLLERGIDIKCVRMIPQLDGGSIFFDIQQIIPLPEAADYQVQFREKSKEQRESRREHSRDYSKFDIVVAGKSFYANNKRQAVFNVISQSVKAGISPDSLADIIGKRRWIWVNAVCQSRSDFENNDVQNTKRFDPSRWFLGDDELFVVDGKTYALSNQHGSGTFEMIKSIFDRYPELEGSIAISSD